MTDKKQDMTFLEHLEELRWHLIRAFISIVLFATLAFVYKDIIFDKIILAPKNSNFITYHWFCNLSNWLNVPALCLNIEPLQIINIKLTGQFTSHINISIVAGLILAFPYVFWEIWRFIKPAFYENEMKHARGAVLVSSLLFLTGTLFGYFIIVPLSVQFLGSYNISDQVLNQINLNSYIGTLTSIVMASAITFELPVVIFFLSKAGLVSSSFLKRYRKHAIVLILIVAAIITPPDVFSQILVSLPLYALYEVGIIISKKIEKSAR
ncbi:MAG: twin arginine-targeting protein translocase TatC [Bacteroidetes bacterium GWC2_33_15]|nr:MAG: twin arginine-targeting protein translocase TatC [Bacteroidetes bacterium GWA2_33_15]OFX52536.1 MAG: twin arginine-targeting protein translocase TatC [Bacteroidetes bacterium GWC2_33_15]OFX63881.1 MAG: twin arginine-targeting protein translocase TatC [Bacteroidetes bacterium GWB2_32_14]OFX70852.1 MAG: twin arginine-targeting protein translocase TatC [Bacteroidetes bacterium GWD2_33_33]HAN19985.1 twin-arginine translocase subunit TatC [Bacteroidales bacterium]